MATRVLITGYAAVTPIGCSCDRILDHLYRSESGLQLVDFGLGQPLWYGRLASDFAAIGQKVIELLDEARRMLAEIEPGLLYGFATALRAWENARLDERPPQYPTRVASTFSSSKGFLRTYLHAHKLFCGRQCTDSSLSLGDLLREFSAETIGLWMARAKKFSGGTFATPLACTTGVASVIAAANIIQDGLADVVIAGSGEYTANPMNLAGFLNMGALSPQRCRPFHRDRSGFNAGEGAAAFVLESEEHARRRGIDPLACLVGWDYRSEAYHITAVQPTAEVAEFSIRRTLEKANWHPEDVEYINAHGTGTPINDQAEAAVIRRVFGSEGPLVSSLKAHIGHLLGASGSVELATTLTALLHGFVPPTLGLDDPDPEFELRFTAPSGERRAVQRFMKFSLGFGGHIGILAIEIPPQAPIRQT